MDEALFSGSLANPAHAPHDRPDMTDTRILITGARAPVALHLARLCAAAGAHVVAADSVAHPIAGGSRCVASVVDLPPPRMDPQGFGQAVRQAIDRHRITHVLPTCEEVFHLAPHWDRGGMRADLFAPSMDLLAQMHNKFRFVETCRAAGCPAPETHLLTSVDDLERFAATARDHVFKPVWSRFASAVRIRPTPAQMLRISPSAAKPWIAQRFVAGTEISVYALARQGDVVALSAYRSLVRAGRGAGVAFAPVEDKRVQAFVERMVAATGWHGQISFDLIRDADGVIWPLECNPRATSGLHFFRDGPAFLDALLGEGPAVQPDVLTPQSVPLAVWLYALPHLARGGSLRDLRQAIKEAVSIFDWSGDRIGLGPQLRSITALARIALRQRISLQRAATYDIEWDGEDHKSI